MIIIFFVLGLVFASFLNALAYRLDNQYKFPEILTKSSACERCQKELNWYDLIPVLSYVFSKGACTKCKEKITVYYPISELFLGIALASLYYVQASLLSHLIVMFLFFLTYFDITSKSIPKAPTDFLLISAVIYRILVVAVNGVSSLLSLGGTIFAVIIFFLWYVLARKKNIFGLGDIIVIASLLLSLDLEHSFLFLFVTFAISGLHAITLVLIDRKWLKKYVPFLPYILIGYILSIVLPYSLLIDMFVFL